MFACPECGATNETRYCPEHTPKPRPNFRERGYTNGWDRKRKSFLARNPNCRLCTKPAVVADHFPASRKELVASGVVDPDHSKYLRPLCLRCHNRRSAKERR